MGNLQKLIISMIVVSIVIVGMNSFYVSSANTYGANYTDTAYMNIANDTLEQVKDVQEQTETATSQGILGVGLALVEGGISSLKLLFSTTDLFSAMITNFGDVLGIGAYTGYFIGIVVIIVVLGILSAVVRWDI